MRRSALIAAIAALALTIGSTPALATPMHFPTRIEHGFDAPAPPSVSSPSWILYDATSGSLLGESGADIQRAPASITKIMTVLLALEEGHPDDEVTVSTLAASTGEREIDLFAGEVVTLGALERAALVHSANDAATAIAEHIGGSMSEFADMMNERAAELGMTNTHFVNPHGLDADGHVTTARDMLRLTIAAMARQDFRDIVRSQVLVFPDAPDGSRRVGTTTNLMMTEYDGMIGVKTGFTYTALLTFVGAVERDGRRVYAIVMGSEARRSHFDNSRILFDYAFDDLRMIGPLSVGSQYVPFQRRVEPAPLVMSAEIESLVHLSNQGLVSGSPTPPEEPVQLAPPPVETTLRIAESGRGSLLGAFSFWLGALFD